MNTQQVIERINELHKIWDVYPSSSLSLEIEYYEKLKKAFDEKQ